MNRVDLQSLQSIRDCDYQDTVWEETKEKLLKQVKQKELCTYEQWEKEFIGDFNE